MPDHPFWLILVLAALLWYSTITVYVAIRGVFDIRTMLARLKESVAGEADGAETTERSEVP